MKFVVGKLHFGDVIDALVTELLDENDVIMSFRGDLLRVQNHSQRPLEVGQKLKCRVTSTDPLRFELAVAPHTPSFKMDVIV